MFVLVLRRTLARGWRSGLSSGFGVATGDAIYAALAAFGVAAVTNVLIAQRRWIALLGGVALVVIGVRGALQHKSFVSPVPTLPSPMGGGGKLAYGSMVALTLTNPPTILSFIAIFAGLGLRVGSGWQPAVAVVIGVMLGSALWWVVVTTIASRIRERLTPAVVRGIGTASGLILVAFGGVIVAQSL